MAQEKGAAPSRPRKTKDIVINLPDTAELAAAKLSQKEIEKLVEEIAGGKQEAARSGRFKKGVPGVTVKSGATVARSIADLQAPTLPTGPSWVKTIWRRACFQ